MGGKSYLLTFKDDELFLMLEHLDWSYLKDIFSEVGPWSESWVCNDRMTWIEVSGMPLHYWNYTTLERVARLWGTLEAYGENVKYTLNCEKDSLLVTTNQVKKIEELIQVQIGSMNYIISVVESGFWDNTEKTLPLKNMS
ncbi:hypothetical protein V6N13_033829 [Hibiscus sabdariffa]